MVTLSINNLIVLVSDDGRIIRLPQAVPRVVVFGETGRNLPGIAWEFLLPGIGLGETAGDSENIHGSRGEEGNDRQRNQGLEHHARFGPAGEDCCIRR
jgi:hypothetical protein